MILCMFSQLILTQTYLLHFAHPFALLFCFVTLHPIIFNIISTNGDQLDGFAYLVACHG